ncbi:MAG: 6-carboxytetrahydropterin synthase QueD [Candidatus Omnitrophota bacterium]
MYEIKVLAEFSSAHHLRHYQGKCENVHGHNWKIEVSVAASALNRQGLVIDFHDLKKYVNGVLDELDHRNLNDLAYFKKVNPTSENIAKYIHDRLRGLKAAALQRRLKVTVWESDRACATYSRA